MNDVCGDTTQVNYGNLIGNVGAASTLVCQLLPDHYGKHKVSRYFGHVFMTAEW